MKLSNTSTHIKAPLSCLRITSNVRQDFNKEEIEELARSIKENGLINPITVKPPVEDDGVKYYEVIAGGRRIRALKWLCEHGDDFSMIDCKISSGDAWTIQMIENIQRQDLSPREKENALAAALESGMAQTEIAARISKPIQWVSDIIAGAKIRKVADAQKLSTENISSKTLSQLRSIPEKDLPEILRQLIEAGGSYRAATRLAQEQKQERENKAYGREQFFADEKPEEKAPGTNASTFSEGEDAFAMVEHTEEKPEEIVLAAEKPQPKSTNESNGDLEEKYSVYGCLLIETKRQQLTLDGIYTLEEAKKRGRWLKKTFPNVEWLLYDELNRTELDLN